RHRGVLEGWQGGFAVRSPPAVRAVERSAVAGGDEHIVQPVTLAAVIMHVTRRHDAKSCVMSEVGEGSREREIAPYVVPLQLDEEILPPEPRPAAPGAGPRAGGPFR